MTLRKMTKLLAFTPGMVNAILIVASTVVINDAWLSGQTPPTTPAGEAGQAGRSPNFEAQLQEQVEIDKTWKTASDGFMRMEKIGYQSRAGLAIPAFVFQPLQLRGAKGHPALVWVHPDIRGRLDTYYIPYIREATSKGYVVIAPEYRGGVGYGKEFYDAIDYGGAEVDDVLTAADYLKANLPQVDPARIGIIGWSHGGMIAVLAITREPATFKAAAAIVPVTNLFQRLAWRGVERQHQLIDPANRFGGLPNERQDEYTARSPLFQIDKLQIPLLVHVTRNDTDVHIEEDMQLVDALRSRKAELAETRIYDNPKGGHLFDRQVDSRTFQPANTREQRDSWNRVWTFFDWHLDPFHDMSK
jgi:dipeptidyl aminopeptidase/acylaminoacyl peptidase